MMRARRRNRLLAALLVAGLAAASLPGVGQAADEPDLQLELVGYWDPNDDRGLHFRVTNVGTGPASAGEAHVETLSPPPANVQTPAYPALEPGKSFAFK